MWLRLAGPSALYRGGSPALRHTRLHPTRQPRPGAGQTGSWALLYRNPASGKFCPGHSRIITHSPQGPKCLPDPDQPGEPGLHLQPLSPCQGAGTATHHASGGTWGARGPVAQWPRVGCSGWLCPTMALNGPQGDPARRPRNSPRCFCFTHRPRVQPGHAGSGSPDGLGHRPGPRSPPAG